MSRRHCGGGDGLISGTLSRYRTPRHPLDGAWRESRATHCMQRLPTAPAARPQSPVILVDGTNVYGSRPDGWWRNRPEAARRLAAELDQLCRRTGLACTLVLDPMPRHGESPASTAHVTVVTAPRRGRDAADDTIVARVAALPDPTRAFVYTSDRRLSARLATLGARTAGASVLLSRIDSVCRSGAG